jgi:hypothetical protein
MVFASSGFSLFSRSRDILLKLVSEGYAYMAASQGDGEMLLSADTEYTRPDNGY